MAKAKKKAKKKARRKHEAGTAPLSDLVHRGQPPQTSFTPRKLALPELWCKIEVPVCVIFLEKMRADAVPAGPGIRKRPAMLARVCELGENGERFEKDLAMPAPLADIFAGVPADGYVTRKYWITRHFRHERKNAAGYTVEEAE